MSKNTQVLIDSLPEGKLSESNYKLVESPMPEASEGEVLVKTMAFAITAGTRAGLQGSARGGHPLAGTGPSRLPNPLPERELHGRELRRRDPVEPGPS